MDKVIHSGVMRPSPFNKIGAFFGHMSNCGRPQYMTRQQQTELHKAALNSPELNGLSNSEKENAMKHSEEQMNNKHAINQLWSIVHLPHWYLHSNCILHGYRNNLDLKTALCSSLCWIHNEWLDIWIDYILFMLQGLWLAYMCYFEDSFYQKQPLETKIIVLTCLSIGILRGFVSGSCHLLHCMNEDISRKCWNLDFIFLLLFQSVITIIWIHLIFYCNLHQQILFGFCSIILSFSCIATAYCSIQPLLKDVSIFFSICFNYVFLFGYVIIMIALKENDMPWILLIYWVAGILSLIIGCLLKYFEYPEIWFLKKHLKQFLGAEMDQLILMNKQRRYTEIDKRLNEINLSRLAYNNRSDTYCIYYCFNSHNFYHIFINGLLIINIFAFREYLNWRVNNQC